MQQISTKYNKCIFSWRFAPLWQTSITSIGGGGPNLSNLSNDQEREKTEMAYQEKNSADRFSTRHSDTPTLTNEAVAALLPVLTQHENPLAELLAVVLNAAMKLERQEHLKAEPYERTLERTEKMLHYPLLT